MYGLAAGSASARRTCASRRGPGERAQVDWCSFSYLGDDVRQHRVWAFAMVLSWFRAINVEFVRRADVASFIQCHINAIEYFGGVPRRCLYDNAKVVILAACPRIRFWRRKAPLSNRIGD